MSKSPFSAARLRNKTRHQHTIPRFLLAEFTPSRSQDDVFWVFDLKARRRRQSTPNREGFENEFYTADLGKGVDPRSFETAFMTLEGRWSRIVKAIVNENSLPDAKGEDFADLMQFVAAQALRTPDARREFQNLSESNWSNELDAQLHEHAHWSRLVSRETGMMGHALEQRRNLRKFLKSDFRRDKAATQRELIWTTASMAVHISMTRKWCLWVSSSPDDTFVCSDRVVSVVNLPDANVGWRHYRSPDSLITCPIGAHHAIVGFRDVEVPMGLARDAAALLNGTTAFQTRWIYARQDDFSFVLPSGDIGRAADYLFDLPPAT